jgi:hypothetical protein
MIMLVGLGILALVAVPLVFAILRSNELFHARVRQGDVELVRGRAPQALISDLRDIFERTTIDGDIRVVAEDRRPKVVLRGVEGALAQRVRNVVGRFQAAEIRAGRKGSRRDVRRARRR